MPISTSQLTANRENAKHSTGPRTPEGKKHSSLNALRHGLTSQIVVMPTEDMQAYHAFCLRYLKDLGPKNEPERQVAQDMADGQWRINRSRSLEFGVYAIGHHELADETIVDHPEIHAALTATRTFLQHDRQLENLSRQEGRLRRNLQAAQKQFNEMQDRRRRQEREDMQLAAKIYKTHKMQGLAYNPADDGFVCQPLNWTATSSCSATPRRPASPKNATSTSKNTRQPWPANRTSIPLTHPNTRTVSSMCASFSVGQAFQPVFPSPAFPNSHHETMITAHPRPNS